MTLLLVVIANAILTADILPVCQERIWVITLTTGSMYWALLALCESIFVAYLFFQDRSESLQEQEIGDINDRNSDSKENESWKQEDNSVTHLHCGPGHVAAEGGQSDPAGNGQGGTARETSERKPHPLYRLKAAGRHVLGLPLVNPAMVESRRMETIRKLDQVSLLIFPVTYIIFFSVMLATNKNW